MFTRIIKTITLLTFLSSASAIAAELDTPSCQVKAKVIKRGTERSEVEVISSEGLFCPKAGEHYSVAAPKEDEFDAQVVSGTAKGPLGLMNFWLWMYKGEELGTSSFDPT
jgi:hypothetical protein